MRINITNDTTVDDLVGGLRLINGNTIYQDGIMVTAMREGFGVLLDELDHASNKVIMEIQAMLEHEPYTIKKTQEVVKPADGFFIVATGNSKGDGEQMSRFQGTGVLNRAFLDRFDIWITFRPPTEREMRKIIKHRFPQLGEITINMIAGFYEKIRSAYLSNDTMLDDFLSPRRVIAICKTCVALNIADSDITEPKDQRFKIILDDTLNSYSAAVKASMLAIWDVLNVADFVKNPKEHMDERGRTIPF